jgi:hypothetical protein
MPLELHDSRSRLRYVWNGSHTVSIYDSAGDEIDCFSFGYVANGLPPTFLEFCAAVARRIDG